MAVYNVYCVYATVSKYHYLGRNTTKKIFLSKITISSSSSVQELSNKVLTTFRQSQMAKKNTKKVVFDHFWGCLEPENLCITFFKKITIYSSSLVQDLSNKVLNTFRQDQMAKKNTQIQNQKMNIVVYERLYKIYVRFLPFLFSGPNSLPRGRFEL